MKPYALLPTSLQNSRCQSALSESSLLWINEDSCQISHNTLTRDSCCLVILLLHKDLCHAGLSRAVITMELRASTGSKPWLEKETFNERKSLRL